MAAVHRAARAQRGVTLIELMVVMVVVAILGSIAVASYRQYTQRAGRTEARTALLQSQSALERCFTRFNTYDVTSPPAGATDPCLTIATTLRAGQATESGRYTVTATTLTATTFVLEARPRAGGGQTDDARCTMLGINQAGQRQFAGSASLQECWR